MTTNIEIKHLIVRNRVPDCNVIYFILYLPVGLILLTLRAIIAFGLISLSFILSDAPVSNKIINKLACLSMGISVTVENPSKKENVDVYVSNSLSIFDCLALHAATGAVTPSSTTSLIKSKGMGQFFCGAESNSNDFKKNVTTLIENHVHVYFKPEGNAPTNGKALLKFASYPFQFAQKIQPVAITVTRPLLDIALTKYGASHISDMLYFMFSPLTCFKLTFLSPLEKKTIPDEEFADIVRQNLSTVLKVEATNFSSADVMEYEKRRLAEVRASHSQTINRNFELQRMAQQVKEVLPHVPFNAIYNDLAVTRNVDTTITNILDGRVQFVPETTTSSRSSISSQPSTSSQSISSRSEGSNDSSKGSVTFNTAASTFAKSANERSKSFQERKMQLIANARRRYIEKHNLNIDI